jgi:uncharacterized membrane protein YphA (DoxX/SURF4 family)
MASKWVFWVLLCVLGLALISSGGADWRSLMRFSVCVVGAAAILQALRARSEYLWAGIFGGVALMFGLMVPVSTGKNSFWPDIICVLVFVMYYRLCIARREPPIAATGTQPSVHRSR